MSRLSLRLRLTLVFAAAMAVVIAAMGAFVFVRLNSSLTAAIDAELRTELQAEDTGHPPSSGRVVVVQLLSPDGQRPRRGRAHRCSRANGSRARRRAGGC